MDRTSAPTETSANSAPSEDDHGPQPGPQPTRFIPGTVLAERYRIIGLVGRGGMGEVYRADDLKLGQPVALKFLPMELQHERGRLDRFLNEVKTALKVTHANVCRVYDIGQFEGQPYISMEYVDGEDLASLLRRIGRLPRDKAAQVARQLCAGLAAAHEEGILHRDLKPANVLIDGRGRAKITDFGLASLAEAIEGDEVRAGTPAYMAPEQLEGKEVTVKSDLYSLGLVLYELFTGKRAFDAGTPAEMLRLEQESMPSSPSDHVEGLDAAVERVILRCLERDASERPRSALAVASALPGGDPLAAALAAGETPSPEMVAGAGGEGGLRIGVALACVGAFLGSWILMLGVGAFFPDTVGMAPYLPLEKPPAVLAQEAREILERLGHDDAPADRSYGFSIDREYLTHLEKTDPSPDRWERLRTGRPPALTFWYRQSPRALVSEGWIQMYITPTDPAPKYTGEVSMTLDPLGRLDSLEIVPPQRDEDPKASPGPDWGLLFEAADLDPDRFAPTEPVWVPWNYCDRRAAWVGSYPGDPDTEIRLEAGAYRGKPVFFHAVGPSRRAWRMEEQPESTADRIGFLFSLVVLASVLIGGLLLARRNLRLGRGDRKGAVRLALFMMCWSLGAWLIGADHALSPGQIGVFLREAMFAVALGMVVWLLYIALEPFLRRRWPRGMITWNRLLAGRFRDPLVGRDVLIGATCMIGFAAVFGTLATLAPRWMGHPLPLRLLNLNADSLLSGRRLAASLGGSLANPLFLTLLVLFLVLLLRLLVRKPWIAAAILVVGGNLVAGIGMEAAAPVVLVQVGSGILFGSVYFVLLFRFGLVTAYAYLALGSMLPLIPTADFSAWYFGSTVMVFFVMLAVVAYAFWTSLAGRPLLGDESAT